VEEQALSASDLTCLLLYVLLYEVMIRALSLSTYVGFNGTDGVLRSRETRVVFPVVIVVVAVDVLLTCTIGSMW